ncbi:MAG: glutathione S-transferase C-terminal domain-containing protein [Solirubrobacterales bacterium]
MSSAKGFNPGKETADDGSFDRQESAFRGWVSDDASTEYPLEAGRYHLFVSWACPWAHRSIIGRKLMGLEGAIGMSVVNPYRDSRGWEFTGGEYVNNAEQFTLLAAAYEATDDEFGDRASTPVLWDAGRKEIVSNESADVLRMLGTTFAPLADHPVPLCPVHLWDGIDEVNERIYHSVNNGVYKAGFSTDQEVYEGEVEPMFAMLDELDERLADRRYLFGDDPVETDWRLFVTLVRFDAVYNIHFKCSVRKIAEYEHLWPYARDLFQVPGIAETVRFDDIRRHYYTTHPHVNPSGLIAAMPAVDFTARHGRERI